MTDAIAPRTLATPAAQRALFAGTLFWSVGVLVNEMVASVGLVLTGLGALALCYGREARRPTLEDVAPWWPLLLFVAWAVLAPAFAGRLPTLSGLARAIDWLFVPVAAIALGALDRRQRKSIALVAGIVFLLSCALAALQHFGVWPGAAAFERLSWTRIPFNRVYEPVPEAPGQFMAGGLLFHRLKFAHVGGLWVLAFLVFGLRAPAPQRIAALGTAAVGFVSILAFPYARAASVALLVSACLALALIGLSSRRARIGSFVIAALTLATLAAYPPLRERFLVGFTPAGSGDRGEILSTGARAVAEHPVAGVGLGQFRPSYFASSSTPQNVLDNPGKAHNQFLSMAAETGVPGLLLFIFMLVWLGSSFSARDTSGVFGLSVLAFFFVVSLAHDPLIHAPFSMALCLALGAASARAPMSRR